MRVQQSKFLASVDSTADDGAHVDHGDDTGPDPEESTQVVCSLCHDYNSKLPISFLILLQVYLVQARLHNGSGFFIISLHQVWKKKYKFN